MSKAVTLDLDGTSQLVDSGLWRVWLEGTKSSPQAMVVDPKEPLRWKTLDQLPKLSEVTYVGADAGVAGYVCTRPSIKHLMWTRHECAVVDLRKARLSELGIDPTQPSFTVRTPLGGSLEELRIYAPKKKGALRIRIDDPKKGAGLAITLFGLRKSSRVTIEGVPRLSTLRFWFAHDVDLAAFAALTELRELEIMGDPICGVKSARKLASFPELRTLELRGCYDIDPKDLPDKTKLTKLARVEIDGTRKETAAALRTRFAGVESIELRGIRTPAWLAANLDNPFREWADEHGPSAGAAAAKAWKSALKELATLEASPRSATAARTKAWLGTFVKSFNALDTRVGIDTIQVEQVSDAYDDLVARAAKTLGKAAPTDAKARSWFDAERTF